MKYAREVQELMAAYPGREFKMIQIVRYAANGRKMTLRERRAMRKGVARVLVALSDAGVVLLRPPEARGGAIFYAWSKSETSNLARIAESP